MGNAPNPQERSPRPLHRGVNVRALLRDREFVKVHAYLLPRHAKLRVLAMMERLRRKRTAGPDGERGPSGAAPVVPEMTSAEIVREINWRIGTLPPDDAQTLVRYIRRLTRWRAERRQQSMQTAPASSARSASARR